MTIPHTGLSSVGVAKVVRTAESDPRLGVQVAISYDGKVVFQHSYGLADIASHRAMRTTTPIGIGSITKQFTAAEIMRLVQDHKLHLSDTLTTLLPRETWPAHITVEELLQHTSGLTTKSSRPAADTVAQTERDVEDAIAEAKPVSAPGTTYMYNNKQRVLPARADHPAHHAPGLSQCGGIDGAAAVAGCDCRIGDLPRRFRRVRGEGVGVLVTVLS